MNYDELAEMVKGFPRIPRRELKCHPSVMEALRQAAGGSDKVSLTGFLPVNPAYLLSIDVFEDDTLGWGEWSLEEDGLTVKSGILRPEPVLNRLTEDDDFFGYGGPLRSRTNPDG